MPLNLAEQLHGLQLDIDAYKNGTPLSIKELDNRANRLLTEIATSPERRALAPQLQNLVSSLDSLLRTLEDKAKQQR